MNLLNRGVSALRGVIRSYSPDKRRQGSGCARFAVLYGLHACSGAEQRRGTDDG